MVSFTGGVPVFSAVSRSTRQLFQLLRCISFASKAHVQITEEGLRFMAEESRVMQGMAFIDKALFTTYNFNPTAIEDQVTQEDMHNSIESADFRISLSSLLETLQIFGVNDVKDRWSTRDTNYSGISGSISRGGPSAAFDNRILGMLGVCRLRYTGTGEPLCIMLEDTGVTTTCELVTYEPEMQTEIPLQKDALAHKIIMRASWLYDAIVELSSTSPTRLTIVASPTPPFFTLSASGPLGSATVEFSKDPELLETFQVSQRVVNTYKYSLIKGAMRTMAIAGKVSIRVDEQGVLNLQFMIEVEGGNVSFVDFRFVPFLPEEGDDELEDETVDEVADEN